MVSRAAIQCTVSGFSIVKTGPRYIVIYRNNRTNYACRYLPVRALRISAINIKEISALIFPIYPRYISSILTVTSTFCWSCQISSSKYHHQNAKISAKYCWIMQVWPSEYRQNVIQISAIITWLITWISTIFYLDFLTVISRIITVTRYACRYLTVTLFISNNGKPW